MTIHRVAIGVCSLLVAAYLIVPNMARADDRGLKVQPAGQVSQWPGGAKRWALVIGVDQYADKQITPLTGAANDARTLASALVANAGFPAEQVILLASDQPEGRQPNRGVILKYLVNLAGQVPTDGLLFVSFSGHGIERNHEAYLLPADAQLSDNVALLEETAIRLERIKDLIRATKVGQVVFALDACRNDPSAGRSGTPNPMTEAFARGFNFDVANHEVTAFATIYATAVGQRAYEYAEKHQGYFTWALVEGLKGAAVNEKGEVTLASLVEYVQVAVPKRTGLELGQSNPQRPFAVIEGYKADSLVISVAPKPAVEQVGTPGPDALEIAYWQTIEDSTNPKDFKAYLKKYPKGAFASLAKIRANGGPGPVRVSGPAGPAAPIVPLGGTLASGETTLVGTIYDPYGRPMVGAKVTATSESDGSVYNTKTDENGEYRLSLPNGRYKLRAFNGDEGAAGSVAVEQTIRVP